MAKRRLATTCLFEIVILMLFSHLGNVKTQGMDGSYFCLCLKMRKFKFIKFNFKVLPTHPKNTWASASHLLGDQVTTLLNKPYSPATYASMASYIYQMYGEQAIIDIQSKQACRLNSNWCNDNSQCCSKFCRCVKWNGMGKEVCWRKCL